MRRWLRRQWAPTKEEAAPILAALLRESARKRGGRGGH